MNEADPQHLQGFDAGRHLDAMAPALGLTITQAQRPAILLSLTVAHGMATMLAAAPIADDGFETAPVFRPGRADAGERR